MISRVESINGKTQDEKGGKREMITITNAAQIRMDEAIAITPRKCHGWMIQFLLDTFLQSCSGV
jgi:hypothetical protein